MTSEEFQLAGFIANANGKLGSPIRGSKCWFRPDVELRLSNGSITWRRSDMFPASGAALIIPDGNMFDDFVQLWDCDEEIILRFAKKWGPLRINERGEPLGLKFLDEPVRMRKISTADVDRLKIPPAHVHQSPNGILCAAGFVNPAGRDSLHAWRFFSRRAYAVLKIAAALYGGKDGDADDWKYLSSQFGDVGDTPPSSYGMQDHAVIWNWGDPQRHRCRVLSDELNHWLTQYNVRLSIVWSGEAPQVELEHAPNLLGAIGLQLMLTVLKEQSVYTCSGCGVPYRRAKKRPKTGDANFCEKCGHTEACRQAQRRRRERIAKARSLRAAGATLRQISSELGISMRTAQGWTRGDVNGKTGKR